MNGRAVENIHHDENRQRKISLNNNGKGGDIIARNEETSKRVGKMALQLLRNKKSSRKVKSVAGSALTQRPNKKRK